MPRTAAIRTLSALPNVGERLATRLYEELGIRNVAELVEAGLTHRLQGLHGIGERREQQILQAAEAAVDTIPTAPLGELAERLRCPGCGHDGLELHSTSAKCPICHRQYGIEQGVIDLAEPGTRPGRSVTQRIVESRFYARFYEDVMRPRLTNVVTDRTMPQEYALATEFLELDTARAVVDVACGTGNFTRSFAQSMLAADDPGLLVGMDISWPMLETARTYLRRKGLHEYVQLVRSNATHSSMRSESFDRLHCAGSLHLMEDIDAAVREFARLLEPGGICVVGTFVLGRGFGRRLLKRVAELPTQFHWFAPNELDRRMARVGLQVVDKSVEGDALTVKALRVLS